MSVVAKFRANSVKYFDGGPDVRGAEVILSPVAADAAHPENEIFGKATPSGEIRMCVMTMDAANEFMKGIGQEFTVTFQRARPKI